MHFRSNVFEKMENRFFIWIDGEMENNMPLSLTIIMEKGDTSGCFVDSGKWFHRFKNRNNLHNVLINPLKIFG